MAMNLLGHLKHACRMSRGKICVIFASGNVGRDAYYVPSIRQWNPFLVVAKAYFDLNVVVSNDLSDGCFSQFRQTASEVCRVDSWNTEGIYWPGQSNNDGEPYRSDLILVRKRDPERPHKIKGMFDIPSWDEELNIPTFGRRKLRKVIPIVMNEDKENRMTPIWEVQAPPTTKTASSHNQWKRRAISGELSDIEPGQLYRHQPAAPTW